MNLKKFTRLMWLVITSILLITIGKASYDTHFFKVAEVAFSSDKLPNNTSITILQISDLHNKIFGTNNDPIVNKIIELNPDIIVITGDLIDRSTTDFTSVFNLIDRIVSINENVYFVSGNHEWGNVKRAELFIGLEERGVMMLDNINEMIELDNVKFALVGIANSSTGHDDFSKAIDGVDKDMYTILLSHVPPLEPNDLDLTLSGHTHGGQIRFPLIGGLVAPDQGYFPVYDKGVFQWENKNHLYIDSGLGTSILPIRFLNQSQLSMITIGGD